MSEEIILTWRVHPVKRNIKVSIGVVLLLFVIWVVVYLATNSFLFVGIAVVVMLGSLCGFFFPTTYEFYPDKIKVKYVLANLKKEWKNYRSFYVDKNGVLLSPFIKPSRLENFRGLYLKFDQGSEIKNRVIDYIESKINNPVHSSQ